MSEHLTEIQARDYGRRKLSSAELLSLSDHLAECEACRRLIELVASGDTAFLALRSVVFGDGERLSSPEPPSHLTAEQTAGYVEGILAGEDFQTIADHLGNCEQCALAVGDLGDFIAQTSDSLDGDYRATAAPSPAPAPVHKRRTNGSVPGESMHPLTWYWDCSPR